MFCKKLFFFMHLLLVCSNVHAMTALSRRRLAKKAQIDAEKRKNIKLHKTLDLYTRRFVTCRNTTQLPEDVIFTLLLFSDYGKRSAVYTDRQTLGYNGSLMPIVNERKGIRGGFIIEKAQPSTWNGLWYDTSRMPEDIIIVAQEGYHGDNQYFYKKYSGRIKARNERQTTLWSCLVFDEKEIGRPCSTAEPTMDWQLAILWESFHPEGNKLYITLARLSKIKEAGDVFDLDENKVGMN